MIIAVGSGRPLPDADSNETSIDGSRTPTGSGGSPVSGVAHLSLPWRRIGFRVAPSRQGKDLPQFRITRITRNTAGNILSNHRAVLESMA